MKRITNIFLGIVATLTFMSCNDFLDQKINDNYDEEMFSLPETEREEKDDFGYWCRQVHQIRV